MNFFSRLKKSVAHSLMNAGRSRVRQELLMRGDSFIANAGFSKELLLQGNDAWPWRLDGQTANGQAARRSAKASAADAHRVTGTGTVTAAAGTPGQTAAEQARAVAELQACTDAELNDLGISRAGIVDAVRYGRPGIDSVPASQPQKQAA